MNLFQLSLSYLRRRWLTTVLNVLLLALGLATIVVLLLFDHQLEETRTRNAAGIDLVVGASGSPMQLILSSIFHIDAPTGNIPLAEAERIQQNRMVKEAIPLALGDSYQGYRIVGTTAAYPAHYGAELEAGQWWGANGTLVIGSRVAAEAGLALGDTVVSMHGLGERGMAHGEMPLVIVGQMARTGTVLDRLILTSVETVWAVHGDHGDEDNEGDHGDEDDHQEEAADEHGHAAAPAVRPAGPPRPGAPAPQGRQLTALLIKYASPIAAAMLPRFVDSIDVLQAAAPAREMTRLFSLLGIGVEAIRAFAFILIFAAALGVFIALYNALKARRYDLAVMRALGATRAQLLQHVLLEGLLLAGIGGLLGLALGHGAMAWLAATVAQAEQMELTGWVWVEGEGLVLVLALGVGLLATLIPALQAYRTDIAHTLARG